ncbi:hypothetical protein [Thermocrinis minervae]|uniref:hypothetical protein n=1 Tax=Thermocrinis minervae TaxID=381751 RepID=UPI0009A88AD7|nr:hypothetical protein [Thermocrinis minervae]
MKKLLLILYSLGKGGAEKVASVLSLYLKSFEKTIILFQNEIDYPYEGEVLIWDLPASMKLLTKVKRFYLRYKKLKDLKERQQFDVPLVSWKAQIS